MKESKTQIMAQNLKINILAQDKTKQAFNGIRGGLDKLKSAVFSVKGALVGIGAGLVVKSFVNTGRSIEDLQVRLKQLFGKHTRGCKSI
jgi:phage tail tape-measure protein